MSSNHTHDDKAPDLNEMWRQWRDLSVENWSWMAGQAASGEAFAQASTATMETMLAGAKRVRETVGQGLDSMEIPRRSDLARLSTQVLTVEARVAEVEDRLDAVHADLRSLRRLMEDVRTSLDRNTEFEARIAGLEEALKSALAATPAAEPERATEKKPQSNKRRKTS